MHGLFAGFVKARVSLVPKTGGIVLQRASYVEGKPPKDKIGVLQTVFVLAVMSLTILGPSGWILSHLDDYRGKN